MTNARYHVPPPKNEPNLTYAPGTPERAALKARVAEMSASEIEIPVVVGGKAIRTGNLAEVRIPHRHGHVLARFHQAGAAEVALAADAAREARREWGSLAWDDRAAVFLKAAELLAGPWRQVLNGATMLGQSKTAHQAEIDSACEAIDFWRWNVAFADEIYAQQPVSSPGIWNRLEHRPLEGFVFAVTPFNFTAIAANLPTAPAILGNTVLWKPASTAVYSGWYLLKLLEEAGLPPGVVNFLPGAGRAVGDPALAHPDFAGIHFTGSTPVFQGMWRTIAGNLPRYRSYPRIVGETGGKDFVFAHPSANVDALVTALVRGAFEYQGQKCSAASRAYVPRSLWPKVKERLVAEAEALRMGDPGRLPELPGRGHRPERLRHHRRVRRVRPPVAGGEDPGRRPERRVGGLVHPPHRGRDHEPALQADGGGDLRAGAHRLRLPGRPARRGAAHLRRDLAVRAHRRRLRPGPPAPSPTWRGCS